MTYDRPPGRYLSVQKLNKLSEALAQGAPSAEMVSELFQGEDLVELQKRFPLLRLTLAGSPLDLHASEEERKHLRHIVLRQVSSYDPVNGVSYSG